MPLSTAKSLTVFYAQFIPHGLEVPLLVLLLYGVYLLLSAGILMTALKTAGGSVSYLTDLPRGVFTILIRDLIALPLIAIILISPLIGILIAFLIWLGILRFMFQITWVQAFLTWLVGGIIQLVLVALVIVPLFLLL